MGDTHEHQEPDRRVALAASIHDLHARLGSIRMAVTAVAGLELDGDTRTSMLEIASDESVRAAAELAGIAALMTCLLDHSDVSPCDVAAALAEASDAARLAGLEVDVSTDGPMVAHADVDHLKAVLPALLRLVGGAGGGVAGSVTVEADRVEVRLRRRGEDTDDIPPIARHLADVLGARHGSAEGGLAFSLECVR